MWIKCLAEGQKVPGIDGNRTWNPLIQSQGFNPIYHGTCIPVYLVMNYISCQSVLGSRPEVQRSTKTRHKSESPIDFVHSSRSRRRQGKVNIKTGLDPNLDASEYLLWEEPCGPNIHDDLDEVIFIFPKP